MYPELPPKTVQNMGWVPHMIKNNLNSQQRAEKECQK